MNSARSWLVWAIAAFAYLAAVLQRTSLGVAGVEAAHRFDVSASVLSTLTVVQLVVYAGLQIPVGVVLDRVGPKALIATGASLMVVGQVLLALAPSIGVAILGRILVGAGDAMTFISVIRLLSSWFSGRLLPQMLQWTGTIGSLGQILSAIPLSLLLHSVGWTPAFISIAAVSLLALILVLMLVSNGRQLHPQPDRSSGWRGAIGLLRESLARPGTQLGFWAHFVAQGPANAFGLLWGFPFLVSGLGFSQTDASSLLTLMVVVGVVSGPILGVLAARFPLRRSNLILVIVITTAAVWAIVLSWPGHPPVWLIVVLVLVLGAGGPGSLIGLDFARSFNPLRSQGSASGVVNIGGFLASFVIMYFVGLLLDLLNQFRMSQGLGSEMFALGSFRIAFLVQYLVIGIGVLFLVKARRRTRRRMHEDEGIEVAPLWVALSRSLKRRTI